jgi:hypothetical protein
MTTRTAVTEREAGRIAEWVEGLTVPFTLTVREGKLRSLSQNALLHKWFGEIARHFGDRDALTVKGQCHVDYGVDIRRRDPLFDYIWRHSLAHIGYEKQCAFFEKQYRKVESRGSVLQMTSAMMESELSEYMTPMARDYRAQGVRLTDPELQKYENETQEGVK